MKSELRVREGTAVQRLLVGLVSLVCRYPWLTLCLSITVAALSTYASYTGLEYRTQRTDLVSPNKDYQKRWRAYLQKFGDDDDMVVVVRGGNRERMQQALDTLAAGAQQHPDLFDRLFYKVDLRHLHNRALLYLPAEEIRQIRDNLQCMRLLLQPPPIIGTFDPLLAWRELTVVSLLREARLRADRLEPGKPLSPADDQFFTQLRSICQSATAALDDPDHYRNPWSSLIPQHSGQKDLLAEPQYFFSGDGSLAFLLVRPVKVPGSFTPSSESVETIRQLIASCRPDFPELEFGLTGLPVLENDEMAASERDTKSASYLALAGVLVLYLVFFRSVRFTVLAIITLLAGTAWATGWMVTTVGHLNILSATFAVMLIGMGDYGVLWVTRYAQDRKSADVLTAMRRTAFSVGPGIVTAGTTTALGFFAAMLADFQAVAELGWIAGCGVLLCVLSTLTTLPALLRIVDRGARFKPLRLWGTRGHETVPVDSAQNLPPWLPGLAARPRWAIVAGVVLTAVLGYFAFRIPYDHNLLHLQARGLESVQWELTLIDHTAGANWHALSYTATPEEALALKARYEKLPEVSRVVEVASLVPAEQDQKVALLGDIQDRLRYLPRRGSGVPHRLSALGELRQEVSALRTALGQVGAARPVLADVARALAGLQDRIDRPESAAAGAARLQRFENQLTQDLIEDLYRLRDVSTPASVSLAELPAGLRERYIGKNGEWLLQVYARDCLWDFAPLAHFVRQIHTVDPEATGKPFATLEGLRSMKRGFQWAGLYAFVAIFFVLLADFRSLRNTLLCLLPLVMGMLFSLGLMQLCGLPLNPANMIAFPLILGVGVDNGVHVINDYRLRRWTGKYMLSHVIGQGTLISALATMLGFGTLMLSQHRGLFGLGFILTLGMTCCMTAALFFLPAVLRLLGPRPVADVPAEVLSTRAQVTVPDESANAAETRRPRAAA
jgi:hopanoid biosynthesis associated RND transporter like protein HpnN